MVYEQVANHNVGPAHRGKHLCGEKSQTHQLAVRSTKACVRCAAYVVTQRNVRMASSEINAKNATQRYSVAQLNLDSPQ